MVQKQQHKLNFSKFLYALLGGLLFSAIGSNPVLAQTVSDIGGNISASIQDVPSLVTGIAYILGIVFAVYGVIKMKEHVDSPNQVGIKFPIISLLIGGGMFALPTLYDTLFDTIQPGANPGVSAYSGGIGGIVGAIVGLLPIQGLTNILDNILDSLEDIPSLITGVAYILATILGVTGLLKVKEHVEEGRVPLKDAIVRLVIAGMLFALPTVYDAMLNLIDGSFGLGLLAVANITYMNLGMTTESTGFGCAGTLGSSWFSGMGLGAVICSLFVNMSPLTAFLTVIAYLFGLIVGVWGILRIKEYVENPNQVSMWDPVAKILVAGGFFALPYVAITAYDTVATLILPHTNSLNGQARTVAGPGGLDGMIRSLVNDTFMPMSVLINWFGVVAGSILVFIGISRLMKSAQEGARGPGGIGTIMTFVSGGALLAFSPMITSIGTSLFLTSGLATTNKGTLKFTGGMDRTAIDRAESVIDSVLLFVMMLGLISVARGIFIMRGVAEGNSQASSMAAVTHIIGGAIAINLGPFLNAAQTTLGIFGLGLGIEFN